MPSQPVISGSVSKAAWYQASSGTIHTPRSRRGAVCTPSRSHSEKIWSSFCSACAGGGRGAASGDRGATCQREPLRIQRSWLPGV